jgi:hypothetical protein
MLSQKLNQYWAALEKRQQEKLKLEQSAILKKRAEKYNSPDKAKETRADLPAAEKIQVLRNSLASRNNIGAFDERATFITKSSNTTTGLSMPPTSFSKPTPISLSPI